MTPVGTQGEEWGATAIRRGPGTTPSTPAAAMAGGSGWMVALKNTTCGGGPDPGLGVEGA